jgi:hypothetical protein
MLTELRCQVKAHTISKLPRQKILHIFQNFYFILFFYFINNKQNMQYGNDIICKCKITPVNVQ